MDARDRAERGGLWPFSKHESMGVEMNRQAVVLIALLSIIIAVGVLLVTTSCDKQGESVSDVNSLKVIEFTYAGMPCVYVHWDGDARSGGATWKLGCGLAATLGTR